MLQFHSAKERKRGVRVHQRKRERRRRRERREEEGRRRIKVLGLISSALLLLSWCFEVSVAKLSLNLLPNLLLSMII